MLGIPGMSGIQPESAFWAGPHAGLDAPLWGAGEFRIGMIGTEEEPTMSSGEEHPLHLLHQVRMKWIPPGTEPLK